MGKFFTGIIKMDGQVYEEKSNTIIQDLFCMEFMIPICMEKTRHSSKICGIL